MTSLPIYEILTFAIFTLILLGAMLLGMLIIMPLANLIEYKCDEAIEKRKKKISEFANKNTEQK